jgi:hypothetical protein
LRPQKYEGLGKSEGIIEGIEIGKSGETAESKNAEAT